MSYCQPDFYHFSEDSLWLAKEASQYLIGAEGSGDNLKGLDLCAGSGVVGLEIMQYINQRENKDLSFDFCEIQPEFVECIHKNLDLLSPSLSAMRSQIFPYSFERLRDQEEFKGLYDLIVSNPPYFDPRHFRLSPGNPQRNLCRFFLQGSWESFWQTIALGLKPGGMAFICERRDLPLRPLGHELGFVVRVFEKLHLRIFAYQKL